MEKIWTTPVIVSLCLSAISAIGLPICIGIEHQTLVVGERQLDIMDAQERRAVGSAGVPNGQKPAEVHMSGALLGAYALGVLPVVSLAFMTVILFKRSSGPQREQRSTPTQKGFVVHKARWGNAQSHARIDDVLMSLPLNALAFHLSPDAFKPHTTAEKADPAPGPGKFLEIACSYPGQPSEVFRRNEGDIVVLPPDPRLFKEGRELEQKIADDEKKYAADLIREKQTHETEIATLKLTHAEEIEKLKRDAVMPVQWRSLTLQKVWYEPSRHDSEDQFRDKVRFIMTTSRDLDIWTPLWESSDVAHQSPLTVTLYKEGPKGRLANDWESQGQHCLRLLAGASFAGWIGLLQPSGEGLAVRVNKGTTGTLQFPVKIEGKLTYERVPI